MRGLEFASTAVPVPTTHSQWILKVLVGKAYFSTIYESLQLSDVVFYYILKAFTTYLSVETKFYIICRLRCCCCCCCALVLVKDKLGALEMVTKKKEDIAFFGHFLPLRGRMNVHHVCLLAPSWRRMKQSSKNDPPINCYLHLFLGSGDSNRSRQRSFGLVKVKRLVFAFLPLFRLFSFNFQAF